MDFVYVHSNLRLMDKLSAAEYTETTESGESDNDIDNEDRPAACIRLCVTFGVINRERWEHDMSSPELFVCQCKYAVN